MRFFSSRISRGLVGITALALASLTCVAFRPSPAIVHADGLPPSVTVNPEGSSFVVSGSNFTPSGRVTVYVLENAGGPAVLDGETTASATVNQFWYCLPSGGCYWATGGGGVVSYTLQKPYCGATLVVWGYDEATKRFSNSSSTLGAPC